MFPRHKSHVSAQTHVDESRVVSLLEVVQHRGLVQAGELCHVLHLVKFRGVHLLNVILIYLHLRFTKTTQLSDRLSDSDAAGRNMSEVNIFLD